jgi:hypothetical protein
VTWGVVVGAIQAASPLGFWWFDPATVYALGLAAIAFVYIGFAVADGRWRVIALECAVAMAFVVIAAAGITGPTWLLVLGFAAHGLKDVGRNGANLFRAPAGGLHSAPPSTGSSLWSSRSRSSQVSNSDHSGYRSEDRNDRPTLEVRDVPRRSGTML